MFDAPQTTFVNRKTVARGVSLALICLLLAACAHKNAAQRGLNAFPVAPGMTIFLPDGWKTGDTANYNAAMDNLGAQMPIAIPKGTALFCANRATPEGKPAAMVGISRSSFPGLGNEVLRGLTPDEKQQLLQAMNFIMQGMSAQLKMPLLITESGFKNVGRYEILQFSGQNEQVEGKVPGWESLLMRFHIAFFFLPENAVVLTYINMPQNAPGAEEEFARILTAFEPDAAYKPAPPPARLGGELMPQYMLRAGGQGHRE